MNFYTYYFRRIEKNTTQKTTRSVVTDNTDKYILSVSTDYCASPFHSCLPNTLAPGS